MILIMPIAGTVADIMPIAGTVVDITEFAGRRMSDETPVRYT